MSISSKREKICIFGIFLLIFLTSSFTVTCDAISSSATILLWIFLLGICVLARSKLSWKLSKIYVIMTFLYLASTIVNKQDFFVQTKILFALTVAFVYVNAFSRNEIMTAFIKVMFVIAIVSIPLYFISITFPSAISFSLTPGSNGRSFYNLFIYGYMLNSNRNSGLFWEPGAYSTFLNFALFLILNDQGIKIDKKPFKIVVLIAALITTFSTAGYVTFAICLIAFLFDNNISKKQRILLTIAIILLVGVAFSHYYEKIFLSGNGVFGKLIFYREHADFYANGGTTSSTSVRIFSIIKPLELFIDHPILGVGNSNLQIMTQAYTKGAITCTFVNWFAINGIFYGIIVLCGYIKLINLSQKKFLVRLICLFFILSAILAEDYSQNALFLGIALLGYKCSYEKINIRQGDVRDGK